MISGQLKFLTEITAAIHITVISVENFYWVLFENLLKPVGLDCWYYYPWGTKQNLSQLEFKKFTKKFDNPHVFFHFDQEPLWSSELGPYDCTDPAWSVKWAKILANSERSEIKKQICKRRGLLDWYFFYHGFAALDWYRDAQYMHLDHEIKNAFLSFNHVFDQRAYRLALLARMIEQDIVHKGSISFHAAPMDVVEALCDVTNRLSNTSRTLIKNNMDNLSHLPWLLDNVPIDGALSARFGHQEYRLWQHSLWHVVNETVFYEPKLHLTEKAFKAVVSQRPFVLVAAPGNLAYLRSYGFQTFDKWIDESYDDIQDPDQRMDAIVKEIARFAHMSRNELQQVHRDMRSVLNHNKQHFFGQFRETIIEELVENFDQCIRIWNNGRIDGRELLLHPDLKAVKKILLT